MGATPARFATSRMVDMKELVLNVRLELHKYEPGIEEMDDSVLINLLISQYGKRTILALDKQITFRIECQQLWYPYHTLPLYVFSQNFRFLC